MVKDEMKGEELGFGERVKGGGRKGNGYEQEKGEGLRMGEKRKG